MSTVKKSAGRKLSTLPIASSAPPALGAIWPGQGGVYAGIVRDAAGGADYHLIIGPALKGRLDWDAAMSQAAAVKVDALADFVLPNRPEASVARANARELFEDTWYWLREAHASGSGYAWGQYFNDGGQGYDSESTSNRARVVRRLIIGSFDHSDRS